MRGLDDTISGSIVPGDSDIAADGYSLQRLVFQPVRAHLKLVLLVPATLVTLTLAHQALRTPEYTASVVVAPTDQSTSSISSQLKGLGGLAALAGAGLPAGEVTEFDRFKFLLQSARLGNKQADDGTILKLVFRDQWDPATRQWIKRYSPVQMVKDMLWPVFGMPSWLPPDGRDLARHYERTIGLREMGDTGLLQISYVDEDPQRAKIVLDAIVRDTNLLLRDDAADRARAKANYLREQLMITQVAEYRTNLASMLGQQEQILMLSSTSLPFAADTLQPLNISRLPTSQRPFLFGMIAAAVGLCLGIMLALFLGVPAAKDKLETDNPK